MTKKEALERAENIQLEELNFEISETRQNLNANYIIISLAITTGIGFLSLHLTTEAKFYFSIILSIVAVLILTINLIRLNFKYNELIDEKRKFLAVKGFVAGFGVAIESAKEKNKR